MWVSVEMQKAGWTTEASNRYYYWHDQHVISINVEIAMLKAERKKLVAEKALIDLVNGWQPHKDTIMAYRKVTGEGYDGVKEETPDNQPGLPNHLSERTPHITPL